VVGSDKNSGSETGDPIQVVPYFVGYGRDAAESGSQVLVSEPGGALVVRPVRA
jgi:hypothetical protein